MLRQTLQIGFSLALLGLSAVSADAVTNLVNTVESTVTLLGHNGDGLSGYRVDLLKENGSGAGVKETTGTNGAATFEVLPERRFFRHWRRGRR